MKMIGGGVQENAPGHLSFMKRLDIEIKAAVGDFVRVATLELDATILAIYVGQHRVQYEVAYFHNGDRKTAFLNESEFSLKSP